MTRRCLRFAASPCRTILLGVFWSDMLQSIMHSSGKNGKKSFFVRHKSRVVAIVCFSVLLDTVTCGLYANGLFPNIEIIAGVYFSAMQFCAGAFLLHQSKKFLQTTIAVSKMSQRKSEDGANKGGTTAVERFVRHMTSVFTRASPHEWYKFYPKSGGCTGVCVSARSKI